MLVDHPLVWPDRIVVRFRGFGDSSLDIDLIAWMVTKDFNIFRAAREEIYLKVMDIIAGAGATLVNNVQTLVVNNSLPTTPPMRSVSSGAAPVAITDGTEDNEGGAV
jgi:MscS family membrane protein